MIVEFNQNKLKGTQIDLAFTFLKPDIIDP